MRQRRLSPLDQLLTVADVALRTVTTAAPTERTSPAEGVPESVLDEQEQRQAGRLMRVNHAGEVSAQALYHAQAVTAGRAEIRAEMRRAAQEENDHLAWCSERLEELNTAPSVLNPAWYAGSFAIGALAGLLGDRFSLGFIAETERQVVQHLEGHLGRLPADDRRSRAILEQMKEDEARHGQAALAAGGSELPGSLRRLMHRVSAIMTRTAYWI